jgi:hypothetical protein
MDNKKLEIKREGDNFLVGGKVFYNEVAAKIYIEEKESPKAPMSKATKAFIFFIILMTGFLIFFKKSDGNLFSGGRYTDTFIEGLIKGAIFTPIIALIFWVPKKLKEFLNNRKLKIEENDNAYEEALMEIENNEIVKKTWAKAFSMSGGDELKTKAEYIKIRAKEISGN